MKAVLAPGPNCRRRKILFAAVAGRGLVVAAALWGGVQTAAAAGEAAAIAFAQAEISRAAGEMKSRMLPVEFRIDPSLHAQEYQIGHRPGGGFTIAGGDEAGEMYGGLDVAESIRLRMTDALGNQVHRPHLAERGIKFNLPLDVRTPSYSDNGDSFQANLPEVWSMDFWHAYFDEMARNRYNVLSLWSLHPFPSLVKVPEFPAVALNDVWRTTAKLDDTFSTNGYDMVRPYMLEQHEVVKKITIEQKIKFWRDVMQAAEERGVKIYFFTWNIFVWGTDGKYGITSDQDNAATIAYFRASVREMVTTYPLLAGIGITAGEHMNPKLSGDVATENWLWRTYGLGVSDALKLQPNRAFRLIHRLHQTDPESLLAAFHDYAGPFDFEYKYSVAHMYSLTNPPFIQELLPHLQGGLKTWVTLRNDDIYTFRWGDPDYARDYVRAIPPPDKIAGFLMGPDGYCWGREAIEREPDSPRQLVMQRQWFSFMLWGRLGYDPDLPDDHFERVLGARFPGVAAHSLYLASTTASKIIPQITRFFWGDIDIRWFPELCTQYPTPRGFYTVEGFMRGQTMPGSGIANIREWQAASADHRALSKISPLGVATALMESSEATLALVAGLRQTRESNKELRLTLGDYDAFAHLGIYYAEKIRAACDLALYDLSRNSAEQASAVKHLETALVEWRIYAMIVKRQYVPQLLNRIGNSDPEALTARVAADIDLAKTWHPGSLARPAEAKAKAGP